MSVESESLWEKPRKLKKLIDDVKEKKKLDHLESDNDI